MAGSNSIQTGDWLLEFAALDLERLTDARRRRITSKLVALVYGGGIGPRTLTEQDIVAAQRELGGFLNAIAHRSDAAIKSFRQSVSGVSSLPPNRQQPGAYLRRVYRSYPTETWNDLYLDTLEKVGAQLGSSW